MTKEEFLSKVVFKDDNERDDALFYIKVKGLYLHTMKRTDSHTLVYI